MTRNTDQSIIGEIQSGNVNAYATLVEKYQHMVFTLAVRMVHDREEAEEIAQDAFVKTYKSIHTFKGTSKFSTWLYRIVYNTSLDYLKKKKRLVYSDHIDTIQEQNIDPVQDALGSMIAEEKKQLILDALQKLPEDDRVIMTLYYYEELSVKEVAKIVSLQPDNVKIKLHRSRKKLFHILKDVVEPQYSNHEKKR